MRHGAHHGAQKSTKTGTEATISVSKLWASASTTHGSAVWQTLQRGTPVGCERIRWRVPKFGHVTMVPPAISGPPVPGHRDRAPPAAAVRRDGAPPAPRP